MKKITTESILETLVYLGCQWDDRTPLKNLRDHYYNAMRYKSEEETEKICYKTRKMYEDETNKII